MSDSVQPHRWQPTTSQAHGHAAHVLRGEHLPHGRPPCSVRPCPARASACFPISPAGPAGDERGDGSAGLPMVTGLVQACTQPVGCGGTSGVSVMRKGSWGAQWAVLSPEASVHRRLDSWESSAEPDRWAHQGQGCHHSARGDGGDRCPAVHPRWGSSEPHPVVLSWGESRPSLLKENVEVLGAQQ